MRESIVINRGLQISSYLLNVLLLVCPLLADQRHKGKIWYSSLKRVVSIYPVLAKVSLTFTGTVLYLQFFPNLPALLLTTIIYLFTTIFMGNYHLKKEESYRSS